MCQGYDEAKALTMEYNAVRAEVFNFHSVRSIMIAKLRTKDY